MNRSVLLRKFPALAAVAVGAWCLGALDAAADPYVQTNLVSDIPGLATSPPDPQLVNPWGVSHSTTSPFWVSNQGGGKSVNGQPISSSTLYGVTGSTNVSKVNINPPSGFVAIPMTASGPQGPTGQVNNTNTSAFPVSTASGGDGGSAHFIFDSLNGTISAWDTGMTAHIQATSPGEIYTGLAINQAQTMLYAANDAGAGSVDVFNSSFSRIGTFANDPAASTLGLVPFNVQDINGTVYVTYAPSGRPAQQHATPGQGVVAEFTENGTFIKHIVGSPLAAPWGITLAPPTFGEFANDLLVGEFSYDHSEIDAFDPANGDFRGTIPIDNGPGNTAGGLWAIEFGVGGMNGSPDTLYFADGINGEADGLFGAINSASAAIPEPSALALLAPALAFFGLCRIRSRRRGAGSAAHSA